MINTVLTLFKNRLFKILFGFYLTYTLILSFQVIYLKYGGLAYAEKSWFEAVFVNFFIELLFQGVLFLFVGYLALVILKLRLKQVYFILLHLILSIFTVFIFTYVYYLIHNLVGSHLEFSIKRLITGSINYLNIHFLRYFAIVFIVYTYYYINKSAQEALQKSKLKEQLSAVQVNVLKYQLHPHFFFNTLNSISTLIETDAKLAQNTLADFSDLLRDIVYLKDTNLLPLDVEMKILKRYLDIMTVRFSDHLKIFIEVENDLEDILIPSLILQPLVENSFKYGFSSEIKKLNITIKIHSHDTLVFIEVLNNGAPLVEDFRYGNGLKNTVARLKTLYAENYSFSIQNITEKKGVISKIIIPLQRTES
ncbi:sensor histidine kinase [Snuella lapsa]|uniref:Signal transduction histidine kinase internal region domain-containing protein n=1 Tax=Snuella lapsa TaxID=870481 RepID=A0ABP6XYM1_9FLAO